MADVITYMTTLGTRATATVGALQAATKTAVAVGAGSAGSPTGAQGGTGAAPGGSPGLSWAGPGSASSELIDALRALGGRTPPPHGPGGA